MFDLPAIEKRHAAGSPAAEDIGDLIAEVKRLQQPVKDKAEFHAKALSAGRMTKDEIRKSAE